MSNTVVHFEIPADDPEKLADFYRQMFGWNIQAIPEMNYWMVSTVPTDDKGVPQEQGINGGLMARMAPGQQITNYIGVDSVDDYVKKAESLGATVMMPKQAIPNMGWFAILTDPQSNVFGVYQDDPQAA